MNRNPAMGLRYSLGAKINLVFILMLILFIIFSFFNRHSMNRFSSNYNDQIQVYEAILLLKDNISQCDTSINDYLRTGNRTNLADFNGHAGEVRSLILKLESLTSQEEVTYLLRSIRNSFNTYYTECSNASFDLATQSYDYLSRIYYANNINGYLLQYCDELLELNLAQGIVWHENFNQEYEVLTGFNDSVIILVTLFSLLFIFYVVHSITKPLNNLMSKVREISKGNFDVQVAVSDRPGTIELLSGTFNDMAKNIKEMMADLKGKVMIESALLEEKKKNMENRELLNQAVMLALQTQTNPHFLFNTLNTISRTVILKRNNEAVDMIEDLSSLMRYSLEDPETPVTIQEELAMTDAYLRIQMFRFSDRLTIIKELEHGEAERIFLPRFTLQPLVENAITHGLGKMEENACLKIQVKRRKDWVRVRIVDNGVGMAKATVEEALKVDDGIRTQHIGISNTYKRLRLMTKDDGVLRIYSRPQFGTLVTIRIKEKKNVSSDDC